MVKRGRYRVSLKERKEDGCGNIRKSAETDQQAKGIVMVCERQEREED